MGLSKNITLTIKDYEIRLDKQIKFYENDTIDLCFSILEYGIEVKNGVNINKLMPIQALTSYMLIETPQGVDYAESTKIEDNKIVFNLGAKYSQFVGIGHMQIVIKDSDGCRVTLPEFEFEIKKSINTDWDRDSIFLTTEDDSIIIDEFGREIHMTKISDMPISENLSEESYAMIIDEEGNKRFKVKAIANAVEDSLDAKFNAYADEISGDVEEFKDNVVERIEGEMNEINVALDDIVQRIENGEIGGGSEIDDTVISYESVWSSKKTEEQIKLIPKGDKGDKGDSGTASTAIDDTKINNEQTWTSSKINSTRVTLYGAKDTKIKHTANNGIVVDFGASKNGYIYNDGLNGYKTITISGSYDVPNYRALVYNTSTNTFEVVKNVSNTHFLILQNIDGNVYGALEKVYQSDELKTSSNGFLFEYNLLKNIIIENNVVTINEGAVLYRMNRELHLTSGVYTINAGYSLVYDDRDSLTKVIRYRERTENDMSYYIELFSHGFDGVKRGYLSEISKSDNNEVTSRSKMVECYQKIMDKKSKNSRNSFYFPFITDTHIIGMFEKNNENEAGKNLRWLDKRLNFDFILHGGDATNYGELVDCLAVNEILGDLLNKTIFTIGNHDLNNDTNSTNKYANMYNYLMGCMSKKIVLNAEDDLNLYSYYDDDVNKVRYFIIDSNLNTNKQKKFIAKKLMELPDEYDVIFVSHHCPQIEGFTGVSPAEIYFRELIIAFNEKNDYVVDGETFNFSSKSNNVICWICGHVHADNLGKIGTLNVISTINSSNNNFDVFVVNKDERKVSTIRVGNGTDREFIY